MNDEMEFDWNGLISLLAQNLYSEKRVFIRELIQNSHDAITRRIAEDSSLAGRIEISADPSQCQFKITDNGIGMNENDIKQFLSTIGIGATRANRNIPGLVGYFGIGFLSAFIVAKNVTVLTRKVGEVDGWKWQNSGSRTYQLERAEVEQEGTTVIVEVDELEKAVITEAEVRDVITSFADMLRIPIHVNGSRTPINSITMPWEKECVDDRTRQIECKLYVAERIGDDPLEIIPLCENGLSGILYVTKTRVLGVDSPRSVKAFIRRVLISENLPDLLPEWASFVNGIISSDHLSPTAARDNIVRNDEFSSLRNYLGDVIIQHLQDLKIKDQKRFVEIQRYHTFGIEAACFHYGAFFDRFIDLLEWRTNELEKGEADESFSAVRRTLPEIVARTRETEPDASSVTLRCFGTGNTASMFFQMATASRTLVIDASGIHQTALLERYVEKHGDQLRVCRVDREDDSRLFRSLGMNDLPDVRRLGEAMQSMRFPREENDGASSSFVSPSVSIKRFEPAAIPALIRPEDIEQDVQHAEAVLADPDSPETFKSLARSVVASAQSRVKITINANNALVRKAAELDFEAEAGKQLLLGLYNSAFLSSDQMSERNASILHQNLIHFMEASIRSESELQRLEERTQTLVANLDELSFEQERAEQPKTVFVMVPFSQDYKRIVDALRILVEDTWACRLYIASDKKFDDRILDSVRQHIGRADLFIAELTDANPNVMFELGLAFGSRAGRPVVNLFRAADDTGAQRSLPADLGSMIYVDYSHYHESKLSELTAFLDEEIRKDVQVGQFLADEGRPSFVSPGRLQKAIGPILSEDEYRELSLRFTTDEDWNTCSPEEVKDCLSENKDAWGLVVDRVKSNLLPNLR